MVFAKYRIAVQILLFLALLAGAYFVGRGHGAQGVELAWKSEKVELLAAHVRAQEAALEESRRLATEAEERGRIELQAALQASEERQAARMARAVRQAALEARTRAPGAYQECKLDDETLAELQEALK